MGMPGLGLRSEALCALLSLPHVAFRNETITLSTMNRHYVYSSKKPSVSVARQWESGSFCSAMMSAIRDEGGLRVDFSSISVIAPSKGPIGKGEVSRSGPRA